MTRVWIWLVRNVKWLAASAATVFAIYFYGRRGGRQDAEQAQRDRHTKARNEALDKRKEIEDEVRDLDRDALLERMRKRSGR